jgi:hypothetical protein
MICGGVLQKRVLIIFVIRKNQLSSSKIARCVGIAYFCVTRQ